MSIVSEFIQKKSINQYMKIYPYANFSDEMNKAASKFVTPQEMTAFLEVEQQNLVS